MKYIVRFRDKQLAKVLQEKIYSVVTQDRVYRIMEFCGGHTHAIHRYGIPDLMPDNVQFIHGPGCPVCVLPIAKIDQAIFLAKQPNVIFCSYADMLRVPGTKQNSLLKVKAQGADVRMVYSIDEALQLAREHKDKEIIFFAIGFETTTPPTAVALLAAQQQKLANFSIFCNHVLTPVAMQALLNDGANIDGFIGPAHVSIIIGSDAYKTIAEHYQKPIVICGFEPLDIMQSVYLLVKQLNNNEYGIVNQYTRAVQAGGNRKSQQFIEKTLMVRDQFEWRGLGIIKNSALKIRNEFAEFDAEVKFPTQLAESYEHKACECGAILRGVKKPMDCKLFSTVCTPDNPLGSCMVSSEGACAAYYSYARHSEHRQ